MAPSPGLKNPPIGGLLEVMAERQEFEKLRFAISLSNNQITTKPRIWRGARDVPQVSDQGASCCFVAPKSTKKFSQTGRRDS